MSTLSVSILALVVFVVGAVLLFNLWQARGSRRTGRGKERRTGAFRTSTAAAGGRDDATSHAPGADTARGAGGYGTGRDAGGQDGTGRDLRETPGFRAQGADQNAWTRERREPTLVPDDETSMTGPPPAGAGPGRDAPASAAGVVRPADGRRSEADGWYAPADEHGAATARHVADATGYGAANVPVAGAGYPAARNDAGPGAAPRFEDRRPGATGKGERLLPDPDEDLGPPQFQDPPIDPIPPEPLFPEPSRSEAPHVTPRLEPSAFDDVDPAGAESPGPAGDSFRSAGDQRRGPDDTPAGVPGARPEGAPGDLPSDLPSDLPPYVPAVVDHVVTLIPRAPVNAERLIALTSSFRHVGSKTVRMEIDSGQGRWVPLQSGVMVGRLRCSVLLANRQGPLNAVELSDFSAAMEALASRIGAAFTAPDMNQVLRQARDLDAAAARLDTQVDLGVEASAPITAQKLAAVARKLELVDRGGRFARIDDSGDLLYTLVPGATSDLLAFVLDVPRTAQEHDPWRHMVACASSCAQQTGGRVVDSAGRGMSVAMIDSVGLQIRKRYQELAEAGLKAGSPAALRVFN